MIKRSTRVSLNVLVGVVVVLVVAYCLAVMSHFDHQTTIDVWSKPICVIVAGLFGVVMLILLVPAFLAPPDKAAMPGGAPGAEKSGIRWRTKGIAAAFALAATSAYVSAQILAGVAQHIAGDRQSFDATVQQLVANSLGKGMCDQLAWMRRNDDGRRFHFCVTTRNGISVASDGLQPGMRVRLYVRNTPLGDVVESLVPIG